MAEVVTGEAVVLDVPVARFPSRMAAALLDMIVQLAAFGVVLTGALAAAGRASAAVQAGIAVSVYVSAVIGYPTAFETLSRGQTLGKLAVGLRVVSDDGGPVRFRQALVRALTAVIEMWSVVGAPVGLLTSLVSARGKRLGDMFAGTFVIQERTPARAGLAPAFAAVPPPLLGWSQVADTSRLAGPAADAAGSYLRRYWELTAAAREELGRRLASEVAALVSPPPPPGTPPEAYLSAVLAVRRDADRARLAAGQRPAGASGTPGAAGAGGPAGLPRAPGAAGTARGPARGVPVSAPPARSPGGEPPGPPYGFAPPG